MKFVFKILFISTVLISIVSCRVKEYTCNKDNNINYGYFIDKYIAVGELYRLCDTNAVFTLKIPNNYINYVEKSNEGYDYGDIISYSYDNCSRVYFSDNYNNCFNWERIQSQDSAKERFKDPIEYIRSNSTPSTIIFEGIDTNGLYWKDIRFEWVCYGYEYVNEKNKSLFDSILNSVSRIK